MQDSVNVLTIAGFDGSGGAGLQADLKTFAALGCYGLSVLTALPIQNTMGVRTCYALPIDSLTDQLHCLFEDIRPHAIKVGMLFNNSIIHRLADFVQVHAQGIPLVLDPVMVATSGDRLLDADAVDALVDRLFPLATLITPNLKEGAALTGLHATSPEEMLPMAETLCARGAPSVFLKGGHLPTHHDACDLLVSPHHEPLWMTKPRINTPNTHGTGCTLSSAIAAFLARGVSLTASCIQAKDYLHQALLRAQHDRLGHGPGPVRHFFDVIPPHASIRKNLKQLRLPTRVIPEFS